MKYRKSILEDEELMQEFLKEKTSTITKLERENEHLKEVLKKQRELLDIMYNNIE